MEEFDEKFNKITKEIVNYIKDENLSVEILKFIGNFECGEKIIKGYDFFKKILFQFGVKNIELNFLGEPEIYHKEYELKIKKDNKSFSFIMIYDKDCDTLDYRFDVRNEEDYKIYEEIVYYYNSFKDCKE